MFFLLIPGILLILGAFMIIPGVIPFIQRQAKIKTPKLIEYVTPVILIGLGVFLTGSKVNEGIKLRNEKLKEERSNSVQYAEQVIQNINEETYSSFLENDFDTTFFQDKSLDKNFKGLLSDNLHKRDSLLKDLAIKKTKDSLKAVKLKNDKKKLQRAKRIKKQFSAYSGAHENLQFLIMDNMNDPDSYEHVETTYWDKESYLLVQTKYTGKNAFNATITNTTIAKVDLEGNILEIVE